MKKFLLILGMLILLAGPGFGFDRMDDCYRILREAVDKKAVLGNRLSGGDIRYILLSIPAPENIPYLAETLKKGNDREEKLRAFFTLAVIGGEEPLKLINGAMDSKDLPLGEMLYRLARTDGKKYFDLILERFKNHIDGELYGSSMDQACRALVDLKNKNSDNLLAEYFEKVNNQGGCINSPENAKEILRAIQYSADRVRDKSDMLEIVEKTKTLQRTDIRFDAGAVQYMCGRKKEALAYLQDLNEKIKKTDYNYKYDHIRNIYENMDKDLGLALMMMAVTGDSPEFEIWEKFCRELALNDYPGIRDLLFDMVKKEQPRFERATLMLALYFNDGGVREEIMKHFPKDTYWSDNMEKEREDLAMAYLVLANKRDELFFKQMIEMKDLNKKTYGCEGLKYINATGKKPELKSLFRNMKWDNPRENPVSFQCARALHRFGITHYLMDLLRTRDIPDEIKIKGFEALGKTGDMGDIEIFFNTFDKIYPELYDSYLDALAAVARQETVTMMARQKGRQGEPIRECRQLMKMALNSRDPGFKRKASKRIEKYVYHWQSVVLLKDCIQSRDAIMKNNAILAYRNVDDGTTIKKANTVIRRCMTDPETDVRIAAAAIYAVMELRARKLFDKQFLSVE